MNQETIDQIINTHGDIQYLEKIKSVVREQRANFPCLAELIGTIALLFFLLITILIIQTEYL